MVMVLGKASCATAAAALPVPDGTAGASQRYRKGAGAEALTPYTTGTALSAGDALAAALALAFDLTMHAVNLGEHVFGLGLHL